MQLPAGVAYGAKREKRGGNRRQIHKKQRAEMKHDFWQNMILVLQPVKLWDQQMRPGEPHSPAEKYAASKHPKMPGDFPRPAPHGLQNTQLFFVDVNVMPDVKQEHHQAGNEQTPAGDKDHDFCCRYLRLIKRFRRFCDNGSVDCKNVQVEAQKHGANQRCTANHKKNASKLRPVFQTDQHTVTTQSPKRFSPPGLRGFQKFFRCSSKSLCWPFPRYSDCGSPSAW